MPAARLRNVTVFHGRDAVFSVMPGVAGEVIDGLRYQRRSRALKSPLRFSPKSHGSRRAQRDANDVLEDRPIAVPADAGAGIYRISSA
jgi:hypothetical protein